MNRPTPKPIQALYLAPLTALWLASATAQTQTAPAMAPSGAMSQQAMQAGGAQDMKAPMMAGMDSLRTMQMSGDTDKDFAMMMKMHHQQALTMAEMELAHGKSPEMKSMAKRIIAAQKKEIAQFDRWLQKHK